MSITIHYNPAIRSRGEISNCLLRFLLPTDSWMLTIGIKSREILKAGDATIFTRWALLATSLTSLVVTGCSILGRGHDCIPESGVRITARSIQSLPRVDLSDDTARVIEKEAKSIGEVVRTIPTIPDRIELSLADVRAATLSNNLDLQVDLFLPEITAESVPISEGAFDAILGFDINYLSLDTPGGIAVPGIPIIPDNQFNSLDFGPSLILPSRTGGALSISRPFVRQIDSGGPAVFESDWRFSISQPLLRGAGLRTNNAQIRLAKYATLRSDVATRGRVIEVLADADRQYWRVWLENKELEIRRQQYDVAVQQLDDVRSLVAPGGNPEIGVKAAYEITRAQAGIAQRVEPMVLSQARLEIQQRELKRIMNLPEIALESEITLELETAPSLVPPELDADAIVASAMANRTDLLEQKFALSSSHIDVQVTRNARLPIANFNASTTLNGFGGSFDESRDLLRTGRFADYGFGMSFSVPITNQTARAQHRTALWERAREKARLDRLRLAVQQDVHDAITLAEQNWRLILAARNAVGFATRDLDVERRLFEVGEQNRTTTEVLNAAGRVADAQTREARAIAAFQISLVDLAFAAGTILGSDYVQWHVRPECRSVIGMTSTTPNDNAVVLSPKATPPVPSAVDSIRDELSTGNPAELLDP